MAQLREEAQMIEPDMLFRYIRIFSELSNQLKYATQKRVMLEVALIKLCTPAMENTQDSLLDRIRAVEEKVEKGIDAAAVIQAQGGYGAGAGYGQDGAYGGAGGNGAGMPGVGSGAAGSAGVRKELPNAIPEDVQEVVKNFRSIAGEASGILRGYLKKARLSLGGDNRLMIVLPDPLSESVVGREDHVQELENLIEQRIGKISGRRNAGKHGKPYETGAAHAASDGGTAEGAGGKGIYGDSGRRSSGSDYIR